MERLLPDGLLVDAAWLEAHGYSRALRSQYVSSGWLDSPVRGVYWRPRGVLRWEQVVISLQVLLSYPVSVGGRTALEMRGYSHYLYQAQQAVHLYTDRKLPSWLAKLPDMPAFVVHNRSRFLPGLTDYSDQLSLDSPGEAGQPRLPGALDVDEWGPWRWPLVRSAPERAILELIDELPNSTSFDMVDKFMEGLVTLRPRKMQALLEEAESVKVKRLFCFFAGRHRHQWLEMIDHDKIDLGKGKRMIAKGGTLDKKYQITVPENMDAL
ncbi:type IV toxin-antitoxin system AbiEi family antitoxin [Halomonas sp. TRM85114]|uniref:type IV toxin-antitoxin system AbiEi family antitoxin domain-containing protein n=1 Tax=Halomonas jincaotanensis TaxID=2810616 RepID=UPI001BD1DE24|nr:type IV toxin-antitoxin system AbiEi family antitoxin domain-containing protein [Halomonas jincaotanensis]MBS9405492.1 type IV toxin-antitoxin system AbiEi family antitoxin [Halomonas jincaotanensis]